MTKRFKNGMRRIHPGELLREEFPELAVQLDAVKFDFRRRITHEIAAQLSRATGSTPEFWLNLQATYDEGGE